MRAYGGAMMSVAAVPPLAVASLLVATGSTVANAATDATTVVVTPSQVIFLSALIGVTAFAVWCVIILMRMRQHAETETATLRAEIADLKAQLDKALAHSSIRKRSRSTRRRSRSRRSPNGLLNSKTN